MTRLLLLILVLANLIAFLAWQGTLDAWGPGGTAVPVSAQVAPERLKVIVPGKGEAAAPGAAPPPDAAGSAGRPASAADAPTMAGMSESISLFDDITVATIWISL